MTQPAPEIAVDVATTAWSAPNPFGEPTAFLLVHPTNGPDDGALAGAVARLGLKRLDADGDILPIGTGELYASLRALRVELWAPEGIWLSHPVTDEWMGRAVARRYVVLAVGAEPLPEGADADAIAAYLADRRSVHAGLVRIRVRLDPS